MQLKIEKKRERERGRRKNNFIHFSLKKRWMLNYTSSKNGKPESTRFYQKTEG